MGGFELQRILDLRIVCHEGSEDVHNELHIVCELALIIVLPHNSHELQLVHLLDILVAAQTDQELALIWQLFFVRIVRTGEVSLRARLSTEAAFKTEGIWVSIFEVLHYLIPTLALDQMLGQE